MACVPEPHEQYHTHDAGAGGFSTLDVVATRQP